MPWNEFVHPLLILAPEKTGGTLLCAMLGQHPEMYGLMETRLFTRNEMYEWLHDFAHGNAADGLLRTVAEVIFGDQSGKSIGLARNWVRERANRSTVDVFSELVAFVHPLLVVERTPMIVYRSEHLHRVRRQFHEMKFLHLVVHPACHARRIVACFEQQCSVRPTRTYRALDDPESIFFRLVEPREGTPAYASHAPWLRTHTSIAKFLAKIPAERQMRMRIEDLLAQPRSLMETVARWLGLRTDEEAVESMLCPEQWPFASSGPRIAPSGGDLQFLANPHLLSGPDCEGEAVSLPLEAVELAQSFGYSA
jgi:hypothetical protein